MSGGGDDETSETADFYRRLRASMPAEHQKAGAVLDRVNAVWVATGRDKVFRDSFDRFLTYITASQRHGRHGKGNAFFLTGASGAGKSDMVEDMLAKHPMMQPISNGVNVVKPFVTVSLPKSATLRILGNGILEAIDYEVKPSMREAEVWRILPGQLKAAKVMLVHIDETQHLIGNGSSFEDVSSAIKGLMNYKPWPISFILSGMPRTNELMVHDNQAERRNFSLALPPVDPEVDLRVIQNIIKKHCEAAELSCEAILTSDMPQRIAHAAAYQFGRICEVTIRGIHIAALAGAAELQRNHFAKAYDDSSHSRGEEDLNPFYREEWRSLDAGYFITSDELA